MSTKLISKILIAVLCVVLSVSICSCTGGMNVIQQVNNFNNFAADTADVAKSLTDDTISVEEKIAKAEKLLHPDSGLSVETIKEELVNHEALQGLDPNAGIEIVTMPELDDLMDLMAMDENGNSTCTAEVVLKIGDATLPIDVTLLSDAKGMGISSYSITRE